ncbi:MAG: hypothetical protein ABL890_04025 [Candidatus Peribacteraceae bacterium]
MTNSSLQATGSAPEFNLGASIEKERKPLVARAKVAAETAGFDPVSNRVKFLPIVLAEDCRTFQEHYRQEALLELGLSYDDVNDGAFDLPRPLNVREITDLEKATGKRLRGAMQTGFEPIDTGVDPDTMGDFEDK